MSSMRCLRMFKDIKDNWYQGYSASDLSIASAGFLAGTVQLLTTETLETVIAKNRQLGACCNPGSCDGRGRRHNSDSSKHRGQAAQQA